MEKTAYLNKIIPKNFLGNKLRNVAAASVKGLRKGVDKAFIKAKPGNKTKRHARTIAGKIITEPDVGAVTILSQAQPFPGVELAYIGAKKVIKDKIKKRKMKKLSGYTLSKIERLNKIYAKNVGKTFIGKRDHCNIPQLNKRLHTIKIAQELFIKEQAAKKLSPSQVEEIQPFIRGKNVYEYQRNRNIPTTEAIRRLSDESRFRKIIWPGGRDSYGPIVEIRKTATLSTWKMLNKYKTPLTEDERKEVFKRNAVWHYAESIDPNTGKKVKKVSAVWKSMNPKTGKTTYVTNTHRAYNKATTLKGAINRYHVFIKGTA